MGVFRRRTKGSVPPLVRDAEALRAKIDGMRLRINAFVANIEREFYVIEETMKEVEQALEVVCRDLDDSRLGMVDDTSLEAREDTPKAQGENKKRPD
jgi:hypothetical protein